MSSLPWLMPLQQQLSQLAQRQQLHHALLFTGIDGVGKQQLAADLAALLLCSTPSGMVACGQCKHCLLVRAGHHPDLFTVSAEQSIGVDAIRQLSLFMQSSPQQGGARVVLMPAAEQMTEAASNALLKTLEEPGRNSFLLLQSAHPGQLLPTILSRTQQWFVPAVSAQQTQRWLEQQVQAPLDPSLLAFVLDYAAGAPLRALALLQSGHASQLWQLLIELNQYLQQPSHLAQLVKRLEAEPDAAQLVYWFVKRQLLQGSAAQQQLLFQRLTQWYRDEQRILGQNKTLSLSALLLDLPKLLA